MRKELDFPQIEEQKLESVMNLIDSIAENAGDCSGDLDRLHRITGKEHTAIEFAEYWGWTDLDTLARIALTPEPPYVADLSQAEIEELIVIIKEALISGTDEKADYYIELLHKSLPFTNVRDYIMSGNDTKQIAEDMMKAASGSVIAL